MSSVTPNDPPHLHNLLSKFGVERLGEGDVGAGANLLAAMACSLANVQRPGSGLVNGDGETLAVGTSLLVSGALSVSLISEKVLAGLATRQNNLVSHLTQKTESDEVEAKKSRLSMSVSPADFMADMQASMLDTLHQPFSGIGSAGSAGSWSQLVETPPLPTFDDLSANPMLFVTGYTPASLTQQLERCHLGRPLVHVGVGSAADFSRFEGACPTIMDGRVTKGASMENIRGTVVVTDSSGALDEAIKGHLPQAQWVSRLLWLVDSGPEPGEPGDCQTPIPLDLLGLRYEAAMTTAWGQRLNNQTTAPVMIRSDFSKWQARWMAFLKAREPECPGISGTARNLYATLDFGLNQLVNAGKTADGFKWYSDEVEALARFLVQRMINARSAMLFSVRDEWLRQKMEQILIKLEDGPVELRDLVRKFHRLTTAQCLEPLHILKGRGRVMCIDNKWQLAQSACIDVAPLQLTNVA